MEGITGNYRDTKMFLHILNILLILVQMFEIQASGQYFKSDKEINWHGARKECDLAIPKVNINSDKFVMDVQEHIDIEESGLWVGYFTMKTAFEYIGCSEKPSTSANVSSVHNSPGLCHTACNGAAFIGIRGNECFCLNGIPGTNTTRTGCKRSCRYENYIACGGGNLQSIYRFNERVSVGNVSGDCLSFEYTDEHKKFTWKSCSEYNRPLCANRPVNDSYSPWNKSVQKCFSLSSRPSNYKDLQDITQKVNPSWSGIIRSEVMYMAKDFKGTDIIVRYGYLTTDRNTSNLILKFTKDVKGKKFALCQNKRINEQTRDDQSSTSTGVTVGVPVAVVLIVIVVTSTVIILKRRNKIPILCIGMAKTKESAYNDSVRTATSKPNVNVAYDNHGYSVASKTSNIGDENQTDDNNDAYTYFALEQPENETYNVIGPLTNENIKKENDYNEITTETNATYDRAYNKEKNGKRNPNDTYDTTENAGKKLKEIADNNQDEVCDTDEDDYNHINLTPSGDSKTDNVYGVSNHHGNFTGDAEKSPVKDVHIGEDTYNHINKQPLKSNKTDNVYGVPDYSSVSYEIEEKSKVDYDATDKYSET